MDILGKKPNLLFLIAIRQPTLPLFALFLRKSLFYTKFMNARIKFSEILKVSSESSICVVCNLTLNGFDYLHRTDGPAINKKLSDGQTVEKWYYMGKLHRTDGPAIIYKNKDDTIDREEWYLNDKLHRDNLPAIIDSNGDEQWYFEGKLHRVGGPALQMIGQATEWWEHGVFIREDE